MGFSSSNLQQMMDEDLEKRVIEAMPGVSSLCFHAADAKNKPGYRVNVRCKWEEYKGTRYSDGDSALVVELWLHRVDDDVSGLTFQEWDPSAGSDDTSAPVAMLVNSSELRAADFPLTEVRPLQLDAVARGGRRARGAAVRKLQGVGNSTFVLSVENENEFRSRCE
jgi:hypothetical protein